MSQDLAFQVSSGGATLVLVVPTALTDSPSAPSIASALERAAEALRRGARACSFEAAHGSESALMRRVEAEVYGTD